MSAPTASELLADVTAEAQRERRRAELAEAEIERLRIAERAHYRTALENGQKLEAAQRENERLRAERGDARHGRELARLDTECERAENERLREALRDIGTREWRDEGGRIAAAVARDALAAVPEERP